MVTVIKKGMSKKLISSLLKRASETETQTSKKLDAYKFCGVIKLKEDPMILQKQWRDEWE